MGNLTTDDVQWALYSTFDALTRGLINNIEARKLSSCLDDFMKLLNLKLKQWKKIGVMPSNAPDLPDVGLSRMMELFNAGDYSGAINESKRIRSEMKKILQQAREKLMA